jgi:hypothetical protein
VYTKCTAVRLIIVDTTVQVDFLITEVRIHTLMPMAMVVMVVMVHMAMVMVDVDMEILTVDIKNKTTGLTRPTIWLMV